MATTILVEETLVVETSMMAAILITLVEETTLATKVVAWEDLEAKGTRTLASTINNNSSSSRVDLVIKWEGGVVETTETKAMRLAMLAQGLTQALAVETSTLSLTMDKAPAMVDRATEDRCHQE